MSIFLCSFSAYRKKRKREWGGEGRASLISVTLHRPMTYTWIDKEFSFKNQLWLKINAIIYSFIYPPPTHTHKSK